MKKGLLTLLNIVWLSIFVQAQDCENGDPHVSVTVSVANVESWDNLNDNDNHTMSVCGFPVDGNMVGVSWDDIDLLPQGNSWCSEVAVNFNNILLFRPGVTEPNVGPCSNNFSGGGVSHLQDLGLDFVIDPTGCISLEFYETYDDMSNSKDADITDGSITFYACPEGFYLPIELSYFNAEAVDETNLIKWGTSSESNSKWHVIQRSFDAKTNWEEIGRVAGGGTTTEERQYELVDKSPLSLSYYRIKEIAFNGSYQYSNIAAVKRASQSFSVHGISPNPVDDRATLHYEIDKPATVSFQVFDMLGKRVHWQSWESDAGIILQEIEMAYLPQGIYNIIVNTDTEKTAVKLVKK